VGRWIFSAVIVGLFVWIAAPFLVPLAMAAVFAVLLFPWLDKLERRKFSPLAGSALLTFGVTVVVLLPAVTLIIFGARSGLVLLRSLREGNGSGLGFTESVMSSPLAQKVIEKISQWFPVDLPDLITAGEDMIRGLGLRLAEGLTGMVAAIPQIGMGLLVLIFAIYFFLVDGRKMVLFVRRNSVVNAQQTERLITAFAAMCRSVILATVLSGFAQSLLFALACLVAGRSNVALIGLLVFLASFVPLIGSGPITFGVAIQALVTGHRGMGIFLLVMAIVVSLVDNFIRPAVLKGAANLHPVLAFVAAFGGLQALGFPGVFLGPIVAGLFVVTVQHMIEDSARGSPLV
jgi:predicted PurR-regulated permease PerM